MEEDHSRQGRLAAILSCCGLVADLYDFTIVNLVRPVLEAEFGKLSPSQDAGLTGAALAGAVLGQIGFGAAADHLGRKPLFVITAVLVGVSSIGCAVASPVPSLGIDVYTLLTIWRFFLGLGIGGEYPLAAATSVENTDAASSGRVLGFVFFGMAVGQLLAPCVVMLLAGPMQLPDSTLWRYAFGFGAVLAFVVATLRYIVLQETKRWTDGAKADAQVDNQVEQPSGKMASLYAMKISITGTVGSWLIYDVVTYGVGLFSTTIFPAQPGLGSASVVLLINAITLPGFIGAIILSTRLPMKHIQLFGLTTMCFIFLIMVSLFFKVNRSGYVFISIFGLMRCADSMGPGFSTFAIPGQIFPTRMRATAHGLSAAAGKIGAVIGTILFPYLNAMMGLQSVLCVMAAICAMAAAWTFVFTPLYDTRVLDDIAKLDAKSSLEQQAAFAESILFAPTNTKTDASLIADVIPPRYGTVPVSYEGS